MPQTAVRTEGAELEPTRFSQRAEPLQVYKPFGSHDVLRTHRGRQFPRLVSKFFSATKMRPVTRANPNVRHRESVWSVI